MTQAIHNRIDDAIDLPDDEIVEAALAELDHAWTRRERLWVLTMPRDTSLLVEAVPGGVIVRAELATFEQVPANSVETITDFLHDPQSRCADMPIAWNASSVAIELFVPRFDLEEEIPKAVSRVAAAWRLLSQSVQALLVPRLADEYRSFRCSSSSPRRSGEFVSVSPEL